jgi:CRISPR-associated protein Cas5t
MVATGCFLSAPIAAFRAPRAREYLETLPVPPPATVYGLLLSAVGEPDRLVHRGSELAIGVIALQPGGRVLRTLWRIKDAKLPLGSEQNKRPDFQELLVDVRLAVHGRDGTDLAPSTLAERLVRALGDPSSVTRFGGLSLGESTFLVDELRPLRGTDGDVTAWIVRDSNGAHPLPIWPDHVGSRATGYGQFSLREGGDPTSPPPDAWTPIRPPASPP